MNLADFKMVWGPVAEHIFNNLQSSNTLKEILLAYKYPRGLPNLTEDFTGIWIGNREGLKFISVQYPDDPNETIDFLWKFRIPQEGKDYFFSTNMVYCPDGKTLKFD